MERAHVLIVEDQVLISKSIESVLKKNGFEVAGVCQTGEDAIEHCAHKAPDLVLMDIKLSGKLDGIETATKINRQISVPIIYITDYADVSTFRKAKSTTPFSFISKPFTETDLVRSAELAIVNSNKYRSKNPGTNADFVSLKTNQKTWSRMEYNEILYLEADRAYCKIVCLEKIHTVSMSMSAVHEQLNNDTFIKVHRSFVVNIRKVREFSGTELSINGRSVPVSDKNRTLLMNRLNVLHQ